MVQPVYVDSVFINCPFDVEYQDLFYSIIFVVQDCGFWPRCALEVDDSTTTRIEKIFQIIESCKYGIHDISRTETFGKEQLPRFNMPLELGLFLGAKRFGQQEQADKLCLILDREPDIAIKVVRNWLSNAVPDSILPGGTKVAERYRDFLDSLPDYFDRFGLTTKKLIFTDFRKLVIEWLKINRT
jgi:hypothetical protein